MRSKNCEDKHDLVSNGVIPSSNPRHEPLVFVQVLVAVNAALWRCHLLCVTFTVSSTLLHYHISQTSHKNSVGTVILPDRDRMAGLFTKQAAVYAAARPVYPKDLFAKLAALTAHHRLAWDVGTGNGQAAISVAEHYDSVVATDVSAEQLQHAVPHPKVRYLHTPDATPGDDLVAALGGEGCVDLITVAEAVHWFELPAFYSVANRVLRKPGGVIAVWGYNDRLSPLEEIMARFRRTTLPYRDSRAWYVMDGYRNLPFPFDDVGLGREGEPAGLDMEHEMSFAGLVGMLRSSSAVTKARQQGVDLLDERAVKELEELWGGASLVRKVTYKAFLLAGTPRELSSQ